MRLKQVFSLFIVLSSLTGMAWAESPANRADRHFALLDGNGDGVISLAEAAEHPPLARHFRAMDKNKDGGISKHELVNYRAAPPRNRTLARTELPSGVGQSSGESTE